MKYEIYSKYDFHEIEISVELFPSQCIIIITFNHILKCWTETDHCEKNKDDECKEKEVRDYGEWTSWNMWPILGECHVNMTRFKCRFAHNMAL